MKKISQLIGALGIVLAAHGQQDPMLSQYMFNGLFLNPAYAGSHDYWTSTLTYRNQWIGLDGAPQTIVAAADGRITTKNMGLGVILMHDRIGVTKQNTAMVNYAYQIKTGANSKIALGISGGLSQFSADLTQLTVWDQDNVFNSNLTGRVIPRVGIGAYYYAKKYYAGISIPTLVAFQKGKSFNFDINQTTFLRRHFLFTAGYIFSVAKDVKLRPSILMKYVRNAPLEADLNLSAVYKDVVWLSLSYRTGDALAVIAEYQTNAHFRVGYAYDFTFSTLRKYSSGSHEIMIGYDFGKDLIKAKTPRYF
jgi:type IX secretion system PorP/SprF family membrane protein